MGKKVKITKEEDSAFKQVTLIIVIGTFFLSILFLIVWPELQEYAIIIILSFVLMMQFLIFAWVFRLRYHFLGPLGKHEDFSEDSDPLKKPED